MSPRPRPGTGFHPLVVRDVEPLTDDSAAITFTVPRELAGTFDFAAGQSLTGFLPGSRAQAIWPARVTPE